MGDPMPERAKKTKNKKQREIEWLYESLNWVGPLIKINLVKLFQPVYFLKKFLPGFSKTNQVYLPSVATAIVTQTQW